MFILKDNSLQIIELTHIPEEIERRDMEKISLSNLILEFFRKSAPPLFELELVCNSCQVSDQLHGGKPHFFLVVYLASLVSVEKEYLLDIKSLMSSETDALISVLHRMGYMTKVYGTDADNPVEAAGLIPSGLVGRTVWMATSSGEKAEHQLLSIGIPTAFDNLIEMMSDIPDSLFSIFLRSDGDRTGFNIRVFAREQMQAALIYINFVEGMKANYVPVYDKVQIRNVVDYWTHFRLDNGMEFPVISYEELSNILQLPFGLRSGIPVTPQQRRLPLFEPGLINGDGICVGDVVGSVGKRLTLPLHSQVNHLSVLGISGLGKSNFLLYYLNEMYNRYDIPFLVIDPVSTEYRKLKSSLNGGRLNVFTPGSEVSPFEFNLFALSCESLTVREYKSVLKDYLRNSLHLFSPLDKLLDETIDTVFLNNGWLDVSTAKYLPGRAFNIQEFMQAFDLTFAKSRFTGNQVNIAASGKVRLNSLRSYFDTVASLPLAEILSTPTVVELGKLQSADAKSTMLLYLLNMVKLHMMEVSARRSAESGNGQIKQPCLILVIDEAHSILEMQERGETMNVAQRGVIDTINQLLLEFRKYGLSVVIADQRVSVLQDVLTNTHVQVIFKQIDPRGKQMAADIISLDEVQMLADQRVGEAFVKHGKLEKPVQVQTPEFHSEADTSDQYVEGYMKRDFWERHAGLTRPFLECGPNCPFKEHTCNRTLRSMAANIVDRYLRASPQATREALHDAAVSRDHPLMQELLGRFKAGGGVALRTCLRVHLLHASNSASSGKKQVTDK